jgi:general secretion pathway protein N
MRIASRTRPAALFGALLVIALLVLLPLRLVLGWANIGEQGLSAVRVDGSVWAGRLVEARIGDAALGDLDARVSPLALLGGEVRLRLDSRVDGAGRTVHGAVVAGRHVLGIAGMTADVGVGNLLAPLPVTTLALDGVTVRFRDEGCDTAEGRVRATLAGAVGGAVDGPAGGLPLPGSLSGAIRCDGAALLVPLVSTGGGEAVALRITADGRYHADFTLRPSDPAVAARLGAAGFVAGPGGWRLSVEGRL